MSCQRMDAAEIFDSIMTDLSGKHALMSEDPRWLTLFNPSFTSITDILLQPNLLQEYCERLAKNNAITGNLDELMNKTVEKVQRLVQYTANAGDRKLIHESCIGLSILMQMMHYLSTKASHEEV